MLTLAGRFVGVIMLQCYWIHL